MDPAWDTGVIERAIRTNGLQAVCGYYGAEAQNGQVTAAKSL